MIAYKVVTQERKSCYVNGSKIFCLVYDKDSVVTARKKTLGIFCFTHKCYAEKFNYEHFNGICRILEIKFLVRPRRIIKFIARLSMECRNQNKKIL